MSVDKAKRLIAKSRSEKAQDKQAKLYSWHAPEVECISKVRRKVANIIVSPSYKIGDEVPLECIAGNGFVSSHGNKVVEQGLGLFSHFIRASGLGPINRQFREIFINKSHKANEMRLAPA